LVAAQGVVGDVHNVTVVLNNVLTGYHGDALAVQSYHTFNARFHEYIDDIDIEFNRFARPVIKTTASLSMLSCSTQDLKIFMLWAVRILEYTAVPTGCQQVQRTCCLLRGRVNRPVGASLAHTLADLLKSTAS